MSQVFVISDTHFGHRGIINFSETKPFRLFETIEAHDEELVRRWNDVVRTKDIVWHLGDFCFGKKNIEIAGRLNGIKRLVMGNHDTYGTKEYLKYFDRVEGANEYKGMLFTHVPVHPMNLSRYYMNVHGHLHTKNVMTQMDGQYIQDKRYFNASCEQIGLQPIPIEMVYDYWAENN